MRRTKTVALLIGIVMLFGVASHVAVGDSGAADQMVVVLVDRYALAASQERVDLLRSFVGLVSTLRAGQHFLFAGLDEPAQRLGPFQPGDPDFDAFQEQIDTLLAPSGPQHDADLTDVLAETFNYLGSERAQSGSTVYLVVADVPQAALAQVDGHLASVVDLFLESEWPIVGLGFPGASPESSDFLKRVSARSGGDSFELTAPDGLKRLAEKVLRDQAMGSLTELGRGALSASAVLTATLGIAPGTREATILTFREGSYGSLRLSNPHGFEASAGDRTSSSVFDSPHVVIWKLVDPEPGDWTVEVRGTEGVVSAWYFVSNKYRLLLESSGAIPLHAVSTLIAFVMEDHDRVVLDDTALTARITSPDGSTIVHELNDAGVSGDAVARDGYFSATVSPMALKGDYQVELELLWPQLGHRISSRASFSVQPFPSIDVTPVDTDDLHAGERSKVATVFVNIQGQPYAVPASELVSSLAANVDQPGVVEVKPQQLLDQNRAWLYDVFFTPEQPGASHTVILRLNTEYGERRFTYTSDSIVLSTAAVVPSPQPVATRVPVMPTPVPQLPSPPPKVEPPPGFPWGLMAIPGAFVAVVALGAAYWYTRTSPYGYLIDDQAQLVIDFAGLARSRMARLLFRDRVRGSELGLPGFEEVSFAFSGDRVDLHSRRVMPTIRVNNQPLIERTRIHDRTWIGTHGTLYSFSLTPPQD